MREQDQAPYSTPSVSMPPSSLCPILDCLTIIKWSWPKNLRLKDTSRMLKRGKLVSIYPWDSRRSTFIQESCSGAGRFRGPQAEIEELASRRQ